MSAGDGDTQADRLRQIEAGIAALQAQRAVLGDAVVDAALAGLQAQLRSAQALRLVSILFLDVVGSTALGQRLEPEEIHAVMDGALARLSDVVRAHGGRVLQYAGDNLLAAFGADEVREDDAERAVRCGLALLDEGRRLGVSVRQRHAHDGFDVRVGIHSGAVLLGGGVDGEGTIRGSAVNVAARLEQSAPPGGLLISVDTHRLAPGRFEVEDARPLSVKGFDAPVLSFRVLRERPRSARGLRRGTDVLAAPLVGRDGELAMIRAALAAALAAGSAPPADATGPSGTTRSLTLVAEAGLGKTRLLADAIGSLPANVRVLHAAGHPQARLQVFGLVRDLLFRHLDIQDSDPPEQARAKFSAGLAPLFGDRTDEQAPLLGQLIGLDFSASPAIAGILQDVRQLKARALHALGRFVQQVAAQRLTADHRTDDRAGHQADDGAALAPPTALVLVLDDLHWSDDGSLDAVEHLMRQAGGVPVLLLCAARPSLLDRRPAWAEDRAAAGEAPGTATHRCHRLSGLDDRARSALARALLPDVDDPDLLQMLVTRTDGNPFYMEALVQMLIDQGALQVDARPWRLVPGALQSLQVPTSLVGVLQALLDALEAPHRRALQQASVVGAVFWEDALASLDARAPASLPLLEERALALPRPGSAFDDTAEYGFRHHLLHEVTYGTVLKRDRREQHLRAARWLERRSAGREAEVAGLIADHYERAEQPEQAMEHWARAAQAAVDRQADDAALSHADRALALDDAMRSEPVADPAGGPAEPPQTAGQARSQAQGRRRFDLLRVRAGVMSRRGTVEQQEHAITAMETLAEQLDDDGLRLNAAQTRMQRMCMDARFVEALALGQRCLDGQRDVDPREAARVRNVMVMALARQGRTEAAREQVALALPLARASGDLYLEANLLNNLGATYMDEGSYAASQVGFEQARVAYERCRSRYGMAIAMFNLAVLAEKTNQLSENRAQLESLITLCRAIGHRYIEALARCNIGFSLIEQGEPQAALDHAAVGMAMARQDGDRYAEVVGHASCFLASSALGRWAEAAHHAEQAVAGYGRHGHPTEAQAYLGGLAWARAEMGDEPGARQALAELQAAIDAQGGWQASAEAAAYTHAALLRLGDAAAGPVLEQAYAALMTQARPFAEGPDRDRFLQARESRRGVVQAWTAARQGTAQPASTAATARTGTGASMR